MDEETAKRARGELLEITKNYSKWGNGRVERTESDLTRHYAIQISQKNDLSDRYRIPKELISWVGQNEMFIIVNNDGRRATLIIDDGQFDTLEESAAEQSRREYERDIVETFDLSRAAAEALADEFESLDDILAASRDTLESVDKIGERRASKILHRRSDALEQRMQERAGAVPAVEDAEGVLRLPEEFEDGKYERK
jgi:hypothetical protein